MGKVWKLPPLVKKPIVAPTIDFVSGGENSEVTVTGAGFKSLFANLESIHINARDAAGFEMAQFLADVITLAKDGDYVPFLTGDLKSTGDSDEYVPAFGEMIAQLAAWFGAETTAEQKIHGVPDASKYALVQHEDLLFNHPNGGGPKYLERPFDEMIPSLRDRIARAVAASNPNGDVLMSVG